MYVKKLLSVRCICIKWQILEAGVNMSSNYKIGEYLVTIRTLFGIGLQTLQIIHKKITRFLKESDGCVCYLILSLVIVTFFWCFIYLHITQSDFTSASRCTVIITCLTLHDCDM